MVAAVVPLRSRRAAELGAEDHQRFVQQAAALQVGQECGDRLIHGESIVGVIAAQAAVGVPIVAGKAVIDLHEPHPRLAESAGQQALAAELVGGTVRRCHTSGASPRIRVRDPSPAGLPSACESSSRRRRSVPRAAGLIPLGPDAHDCGGRGDRAAAAAGKDRPPARDWTTLLSETACRHRRSVSPERSPAKTPIRSSARRRGTARG